MNNTVVSKVLTGATLGVVFLTLNMSGALGGFWRTFDNLTSTGVPSPTQFIYGYGFGTNGWGYGIGYGYGTGDFNIGEEGTTSSTSSSSTSTSSSGGGGGGGGSSTSSGGIPQASSTSSSTSSSSTSSSGGSTSSTSSSTSSTGGGASYTPRSYEDEVKIPTCGQSIVSFSDIANHPLKDYIISLEKVSGLNGNGDGTNFAINTPESKIFAPDRASTRAEYIKMVLRALCIDYSAENSTLNDFNDTGVDSWQAKVVNKAVKLGWVSTNNSTFRVNDSISRGEALKTIMQAAGVPTSTPTTSSFSDVPVSSWVAKYTESALSYGIIAGNPTFNPSNSIKRGESTKMIMKSLYPTQY